MSYFQSHTATTPAGIGNDTSHEEPLFILRDEDSEGNVDDTMLLLNDDDDGIQGKKISQRKDHDSISDSRLRRLLIVDDEEILVQMLAKLFRPFYEVRYATSGAEALAILEAGFVPEVIIADQRMPGMSGAEFLGKSTQFAPMAVRVVLTGYTDVNDIIASINQGHVYRFITKPWNPEELMEAIRLSFEHYNVITQNVALQDALSKLEELNQEKNELIGIVAHDLKNPLSAIRLTVEALMTDVSPEERMHFLRLIQDSSERALELITNLLNIEVLDKGGHVLILEPTDAHMIIADLVTQYRVPAAVKAITIEWHQEQTLTVLAESQAFRQVIDNLLSNAVKYSPHGKTVWVEVKTLDVSELLHCIPSNYAALIEEQQSHISSPSWLLISIRDEGAGFTEEDKQRIFGKFARLSAKPTGGESSTGLGLSIAKRYVEAMNGQIWLESECGKGTTFFVAFPTGV
jgi:signal transduction histidine kinase